MDEGLQRGIKWKVKWKRKKREAESRLAQQRTEEGNGKGKANNPVSSGNSFCGVHIISFETHTFLGQ